jgi:hypothetical protein
MVQRQPKSPHDEGRPSELQGGGWRGAVGQAASLGRLALVRTVHVRVLVTLLLVDAPLLLLLLLVLAEGGLPEGEASVEDLTSVPRRLRPGDKLTHTDLEPTCQRRAMQVEHRTAAEQEEPSIRERDARSMQRWERRDVKRGRRARERQPGLHPEPRAYGRRGRPP